MSKDKHSEDKPEKAPKPETQPDCDPALGDLTPAYIEWFKKNHSKAEYEAKYKDRIPELTEKPEEESPEDS